MNFGFLMIILTLLESGQISAAFVQTETLTECEQRASAVRSILQKGNIDIKEVVCRPSHAEFEPFIHGAADEVGQYAYSISIDAGSVRIAPLASCDSAIAAQDGRYCASSTQKLLSQNK